MELIEEIATYIINSGEATALATDIFLNFTPKNPDESVFVKEYNLSDTSSDGEYGVRDIQISNRSKSKTTCRSNSNALIALFKATDKQLTLPVRGKVICNIKNRPLPIDNDDQGRVVYGFNISITTTLID